MTGMPAGPARMFRRFNCAGAAVTLLADGDTIRPWPGVEFRVLRADPPPASWLDVEGARLSVESASNFFRTAAVEGLVSPMLKAGQRLMSFSAE
jgi:hypothetical protein